MAGKKIIVCDSNVFFDYFRGKPEVVSQLAEIGYANLYLTAVTVGEIYYGMHGSRKDALPRKSTVSGCFTLMSPPPGSLPNS